MEKDDLLVSIIVPVYNTAQYLPECIESIIGQTYKNLEIFLVDDGSVDGSSELCDLYCEKDHRIQVIHKKNSGVSDSRNLGIQKANGDYLMFVDSDDWLDKSMVEKMLSAAKTFSADLVICGYYNVFSTKRNSCSLPEKNYSEKSFLNDFGLFYRSALINSPCNKLYRMDHIQQNHLCFDVTLSLGEDLLLNLKYLDLCSNICNLEDCLYFYRHVDQSSSLTKSYDKERLKKQFKLRQAVVDFCKNNHILEQDLPSINQVYFSRIQSQINRILNTDYCVKEKYRVLKQTISDCQSLDWPKPILLQSKLQKFVYVMITHGWIFMLYLYFYSKRWCK